jgi:parvulin-like peptidyl-prolyl isomerase
LIEALIALQTPGEFAQVIETGQGFFVARLIEKRERGLKPLAEVKELIRYQLAREKAVQAEQEFYSAMKAGLEIRTNLALVDTVSLPVPMARAAMPSVPGGQLR